MATVRQTQQARGFIPSPFMPARPAPKPAPKRSTGGSGMSLLDQRLAAAGQMKKQEEEEKDSNPFGRGLGFLLNNPVTQGVLKPLEVLDYGRRAVTLGLEELAEGVTGQELKATEGDTRSNMEKLKDPTYGVGQLLGGTLGDITPWEWDDKWVDRAGGFIGDVALDPLTYVTGIGGAMTKGGVGLNKANRAALAAKALDAGADVADVEKFVRKGVGAVDNDFLKKIGAERSALRIGTPGGKTAFSIGVPDNKVAQKVFGAPGALGDTLRTTRTGQRVAKMRTPKELETAYNRLFNAAGPASTRSAANRVAIENVSRAAQNTFKQVNDEAFKPLRAKLRRLDDQTKSALVDAAETGADMGDDALNALRLEYSEFLEDLWGQAQEAGLNFAKRRNYSPHILTRDAAKWLRNSGDEANKLGLVTVDLYDPSGVTMRRQFEPGQTIEVNGNPVKFDEGVPVTIDQVNKKFRDAGLKFDFYESNPSVVMEKYLDMLSSDVGQAQGIMSRAGKGSVVDMTDEEMAMLGKGVLLRGGGKGQPGDINEVRRLLGAPLAEGQEEFLTTGRSTRVDPKRTKAGQQKLTKQGRAKLNDGVKPEDLDPETDFQWSKEIDETKEYNRKMSQRAAEQSRRTELQGEVAQQEVSELLAGTTGNVAANLGVTFREAQSSAQAARRRAVEAIEGVRSAASRGEPIEAAIAQIDNAMEQIANDIPAMDAALARATDRAGTTALRQERDLLVAEYERLTAQLQEIVQGMDRPRAASLSAQADLMEESVRGPVRQAEAAYNEVREEAAERLGLNQVIQARDETLNDINYALARRADPDQVPPSPFAADDALVESLRGRLKRLDDEISRRTKAVEADLPVAAAKRRLDSAQVAARTQPATARRTPNVVPTKVTGKESEILQGSTPMAPPPPRAGELDELETLRDRLQYEFDFLEERVNAGKMIVENSDEMKNAKRMEMGSRELGDKTAEAAAAAKVNEIRRRTSADLVAETEELERVRQKLNQTNRRIDQIVNAKGATPDEVAAARRATRETMERNLDPGAEVQAQRLRASARQAAGAGTEAIPGMVARRSEIGDELVGIVNSPETRAAVKQRGVDRAVEPIVEAQQAPRQAAEDALQWQGKIQGRRTEYVKELGKVDEELAQSYRTAEEAITSREAAEATLAESQEILRRVNMEMYEGVDEAGFPALRANLDPDDMDAYERAVLGHVDALNSILDDVDLPIEVKASAQHYLNEAVKKQEEVRRLDLSQKRWESMRDAGKKGELGRVVETLLADGWSVPYPHLVGDNVAMSADLHRMFEEVRSAAFHKDFWPFIDTFTNLFKTYATLTPGFHVRNAISAAFINSTEGVSMKTQLEGAKLMAAYRRADDPARWLKAQDQEIQDAFEAAFGSGIGGRYTERGIGERGSMRYKVGERAFSNWFTRGGQWLGGMVEGGVRLPLALDTIRNKGDVQDALLRVTAKHFDYSQASQFDEAAKRFIPFWTFMSRNLPLQMTQMYTKPRTYAKYNSFIRNFRGTEEEGTPDYFTDVGAFRFMDTELGGLPMYLQPDLAHTRLDEDIEKYTNIASNPARAFSDFNPLLTAPAEFMFAKDLYTGRNFEDDDVRGIGLPELPIGLLGLITGNAEFTEGNNIAVDEKFINAARAMIPLYDRSVRLAPGAITGESDSDAGNRRLESYLRFLGAPVRQLSPQQQRATIRGERFDKRDALDRQRALKLIDQ